MSVGVVLPSHVTLSGHVRVGEGATSTVFIIVICSAGEVLAKPTVVLAL